MTDYRYQDFQRELYKAQSALRAALDNLDRSEVESSPAYEQWWANIQQARTLVDEVIVSV